MKRFPPKNENVLGLDEETIPELTRLDDVPRKLERGKLLKKSEDCKCNRHRLCSSSHCSCKCHREGV